MRRFIALLLAIPLLAQVWEPSGMVQIVPSTSDRYPGTPRTLLQRLSPTGSLLKELSTPIMAGTPRPTYWKGEAYVLGVPQHPAFHHKIWSKGKGRPRKLPTSSPRRLFRSKDLGPWEPVATYGQDPHGGVWNFHPLENGQFLADAGTGKFWKDGDSSEFAVYQRSPAGELVLDHLVNLGEGPGWDIPWWTLHRTPKGLVALSLGGLVAVLQNHNAKVIHRLELIPGQAQGNSFRRPRVLGAQVRPDGNLLMVLRDGPGQEGDLPYAGPRARESNDSTQWVRTALRSKGLSTSPGPQKTVSLTWKVLDPSTGRTWDVPPPQGFPSKPLTYGQRERFTLWMKPDGNLLWNLPNSLW